MLCKRPWAKIGKSWPLHKFGRYTNATVFSTLPSIPPYTPSWIPHRQEEYRHEGGLLTVNSPLLNNWLASRRLESRRPSLLEKLWAKCTETENVPQSSYQRCHPARQTVRLLHRQVLLRSLHRPVLQAFCRSPSHGLALLGDTRSRGGSERPNFQTKRPEKFARRRQTRGVSAFPFPGKTKLKCSLLRRVVHIFSKVCTTLEVRTRKRVSLRLDSTAMLPARLF
jgi:hypothetical protein